MKAAMHATAARSQTQKPEKTLVLKVINTTAFSLGSETYFARTMRERGIIQSLLAELISCPRERRVASPEPRPH
jgi:hypothetical protein